MMTSSQASSQHEFFTRFPCDRARAQGKRLGRPTIDATTENAIRKALKKGDTGIRKIATRLGVGTGTVQKIKAEMAA